MVHYRHCVTSFEEINFCKKRVPTFVFQIFADKKHSSSPKGLRLAFFGTALLFLAQMFILPMCFRHSEAQEFLWHEQF